MARQSEELAAVVVPEGARRETTEAAVRVLDSRRDGAPLLVLASDAELPELPLTVALAGDYEPQRWLDLLDKQWRALADQEAALREAGEVRAQLAAARADAEQLAWHRDECRRAAERYLEERDDAREQVEHLIAEHAAFEAEVRVLNPHEAIAERDRLRAERDHLSHVLADLKRSPSWRLTAPLRGVKRLGRGG
jgi:hypothetical protein